MLKLQEFEELLPLFTLASGWSLKANTFIKLLLIVMIENIFLISHKFIWKVCFIFWMKFTIVFRNMLINPGKWLFCYQRDQPKSERLKMWVVESDCLCFIPWSFTCSSLLRQIVKSLGACFSHLENGNIVDFCVWNFL